MIPTISYPISIIEQPSNKKKLKFRPYLVKEEKILLMAKESNDYQSIMIAIKTIIQNCCQDKDFDVDKLSLVDLEFIFLKLRAISVSNIENITNTDNEDNLEYKHIINFDNIKVIYPTSTIKPNITINDLTLVMKYPCADIFNEENLEEKLKSNGIHELVIHCIDNIFKNDEPLKFSNEEKKEFLNNLDLKTFNKMKNFLLNIPHLEPIVIEYVNSKGTPRKLTFSNLKDFFFLL